MSTKKTHDKDEANLDGKATGAAAGGATGAVVGGLAGGPVGAAIGTVIGAAAGGLTGAAVDDYDSAEPEFRTHYESGPYKSIAAWDDVSPAYRYGFESAGREEYRGKGFDEVRTTLKKGWNKKGHFEDLEPMIRTAWDRRAQVTLDAGGEAKIPVVEEELHVGKRKVEKGAVRVETKVHERPVEEQVHLHEEHVKVERHAVNRPATAADTAAALSEGTLELRETAEEAVVAKRPKVVEEVVIRKEGSDRTQTVRDTVRKTDVEVVKDVDTEARVTETSHSTTSFSDADKDKPRRV